MNAADAVLDPPVRAGRDLAAYERAYVASDFEPVQARLRKQCLLEVLRRWSPARWIEVGCGLDALFNHHAGGHCTVIEPAAGFAAKARADAARVARAAPAARGAAVSVIEATLEAAVPRLSAAAPADAIVVGGLLHEVADEAALLAAVRALCGPATRVHVSVPNARSLHRLLARAMGLIDELGAISDRQRRLQQHRTFDAASLARTCEAAGFAVVEQGTWIVKPFSHAQMAHLLAIGLLDEPMLQGLVRLEADLPGLGSECWATLVRR